MLITSEKSINVGMGEIAVVRDEPVILTCIGLGSCIACSVYDPVTHTGGLAHMLLPTCRNNNDCFSAPVKYINVGLPLLINRMIKKVPRKAI